MPQDGSAGIVGAEDGADAPEVSGESPQRWGGGGGRIGISRLGVGGAKATTGAGGAKTTTDAGSGGSTPGTPADAATTSAGALFHSGRIAIANHGAAPGAPWINGTRLLFRDRSPGAAGELGTFLWLGGSGPLALLVSRDNGSTWSWIDPPGSVTVGHVPPQSLCQDDNGAVHLLQAQEGSGNPLEYSRVVLTHDGSGRITGFSPEVNGTTINQKVNSAGDVRTQLITGLDSNGKPVLLYGVVTENGSSGHVVMVGRTLSTVGLAPRAGHPEDWGDLSGKASASAAAPAVTTVTSGSYSAHLMGMDIAQNGASKDLQVFVGTVETGDGTVPTPGLRRFRFTPSGSTWAAAGNAVQIASDGAYPSTWGSSFSTENYVWYAYLDSAGGVVVKRIDAKDNVTAVGSSPDATPSMNGWAVLSVDSSESKVWLMWLRRVVTQGAIYKIFSGFYNGSTWTKFDDTGTGYNDPWGFAGTVGWRGGLVALSPDGGGGYVHTPFLYVVRGGN